MQQTTAAIIKPLAELTASVEKLRLTVKWVGDFIVLMLLALAMK